MSNIDRAVIPGDMYIVEPSEVFQGIEEGLVRVLERCTICDSDYKEEIEDSYFFCAVEDCTSESIWVVYEYTSSNSYSDIEALPESVFIEHATIY